MRLENVVLDARDPSRLGRFWAAALGADIITDRADLLEARLPVPGLEWLDLCFPQVDGPTDPAPRLHLDLAGGVRQGEVVQRLLDLGARHLDIGQGDIPWVVLADPEDNPCCVMEERDAYAGSGPIAALPLDSADPARDAAFWAEITGWEPAPGPLPYTLRHPCGQGPLLELRPEPAPRRPGSKNRLHLDARLDAEDDPADWHRRLVALGGAPRSHDWGELPWQVWSDPSGNELCLLPAA